MRHGLDSWLKTRNSKLPRGGYRDILQSPTVLLLGKDKPSIKMPANEVDVAETACQSIQKGPHRAYLSLLPALRHDWAKYHKIGIKRANIVFRHRVMHLSFP